MGIKRIGLLLVGLALLGPELALGEVPQPAPATSGTNGNVKIFSDDVFNLNSNTAEMPEYNTKQYETWKSACEHLKDNPSAYRDCFKSEKAADLGKKTSPPVTNGPARKGSSVPTVADPYDSAGEEPSSDSED